MKVSKGNILIVDDERSMREVLEIFLKNEGYSVVTAGDGMAAIEALKKDIFDLVITDLKMPNIDGIELLKTIKETYPDTVVVIITAFGTAESAVEAMKLGAFDYIQKPFRMNDIRLVVNNALERQRLTEEVSILKRQVEVPSLENIIGQSPVMLELFSIIRKVASSDANVLITGESGTGKELVARAIHNLSVRKDSHFVAVNCAAIPEGLLESELFGHMKGAFTGASSNKKGLFEIADKGTIFLDEISEMPSGLQAKLLRVIEDRTIRRVGGVSDIKVDVRIISATNRDIRSAVAGGDFREDLYYRLNVLSIHVPPLRERREDIPLLANHFLGKFSANKKRFTEEALELLKSYPWRGNVRELENIIERIALLCEDEIVDVKDLPEEIRYTKTAKYAQPLPSPATGLPSEGIDFERVIEDMEKAYLIEALERANGVKTEAARLLNLSFRSFRHKLKKYGIEIKKVPEQ
jgi:two-component system response regulator PilR (NtrC family)